jgi:hypothetical protein
MILVLTKIIPRLPKDEKYDLTDQMRRICKAGQALIAEGFAKRYQKKNWQKYIDDTILKKSWENFHENKEFLRDGSLKMFLENRNSQSKIENRK